MNDVVDQLAYLKERTQQYDAHVWAWRLNQLIRWARGEIDKS